MYDLVRVKEWKQNNYVPGNFHIAFGIIVQQQKKVAREENLLIIENKYLAIHSTILALSINCFYFLLAKSAASLFISLLVSALPEWIITRYLNVVDCPGFKKKLSSSFPWLKIFLPNGFTANKP